MSRLIPPLDDAQRAQVIAAARSLLTAHKGGPVRFRHQGRTLRGVDCIGVLAYAFKAAGLPLDDRTDYGRLPAQRKLAQSLEHHFGRPAVVSPVFVSDIQPGDIVAMAWGDEEAHVALVVDHPNGIGVLHAYNMAQRVIEHRVIPTFADKINGVYRP